MLLYVVKSIEIQIYLVVDVMDLSITCNKQKLNFSFDRRMPLYTVSIYLTHKETVTRLSS